MINTWGTSLHLYTVTTVASGPESQLLNAANVQMIHDHLGIPVNYSPHSQAKTPDIQTSYEISVSMYVQWMMGCDVWTNYSFNDYAFNPEMLLFHNELAGYFNHMGKRFKDTIPTDESIAYNAIKDAGPTADYFTHEITLNNMDLQYTPELADYRTYANWSKDKKTMLTNIRDKLKQLEKHQPPPLPKDTQQNMLKIVIEADHKLSS
jgi:trimethylamine:corrinoid methyltransferase-like protein